MGAGPGLGFKAALGQLLTRLKKDAVRGVVPEPVFLDRVRGLGIDLTDKQLHGLRAELSRLGLRVGQKGAPTKEDSAVAPKVVQHSNFLGAEAVRALLDRYRDERGQVSDLVLEGVVRLAGLNEREARVLWVGERGEAPAPVVEVSPAAEPEPSEPTPVDAGPEPEEASVGRDAAAEAAADGGGSVDLADAVAAARELLEEDRRARRPGKRILTAEQEVGLSVLLRGGSRSVAVEAKETELAKLPRTDARRAAYECLVVHNQRLAYKLALGFAGQGLEHEDLFQHGMRGVMRAAVKFDPRKGYKFSTYATWWIRQSISRAIADEGRLIRVPVHFHEVMRKVAGVERERAARGLPTRAADLAVACDLPLTKVEEVRRISVRTDSLDRVLLDGATLGELVASTRALPSVETQVVGELYHAEVMAVLSQMSEREARVLVRRKGLDGDEPSTLETLGEEFGVTRERIRQVESKALSKFRGLVRDAGLVGGGRDEEEWAMLQTREWERRQKVTRAVALHTARKEVQLHLTLARAEAERRIRAAEARAQAAEDRARAAEEAGGVTVAPASAAGGTSAEPLQAAEVATGAASARAEAMAAEVEAAKGPAAAAQAELEALRRSVAEDAESATARAEGQVRDLRKEVDAANGRAAAFRAEVWATRAAEQAADAELKALRRAVAEKEDAAVAEVAQRALVAQAQAEADARAARAEAEAQARVEQVESEARTRLAQAQAEADARAARAEAEAQAHAARTQAEADARAARAEAEAQARVERAEAEAQARVAHVEEQARAARARVEAQAQARLARAETEARARVAAAEARAAGARAEEQARAARARAEAAEQARVAAVEAGRAPEAAADGERRPALAGARHRMHTALLRREHRLRLAAVAAGRQQAVDAEVRLWERAFLDRMDRALARGEQSLRAEFAERLAQLTEAHRETEAILLRRAQRAEAELVTAEAESADTVHARREAAEAQWQLRQHLAECGQRTAGLEQRLRDAEASFAQQHRYIRELEQSLALREGEARQAREAEQQLMERLAQNEWAFRAQIDQLRVQLDAARAENETRRTLRDRWRRD
jgi:RNA polymerase primary sigma factor